MAIFKHYIYEEALKSSRHSQEGIKKQLGCIGRCGRVVCNDNFLTLPHIYTVRIYYATNFTTR